MEELTKLEREMTTINTLKQRIDHAEVRVVDNGQADRAGLLLDGVRMLLDTTGPLQGGQLAEESSHA